jgi:two-component system, NtrC family, response regulator HydG
MPADQVLVAEDDDDLRLLLTEILEGAGHAVCAARSGTEALQMIEDPSVSVVVSDLVMPGASGRQVVRSTRRLRADVNVVVITAFGSIDSAIELVREGAFDYLTKPFSNEELLIAVQRALDESSARREGSATARALRLPPGLICVSGSMRALLETVAKAGPSPLPILVTGETGAGKELIARALHEASRRGPFVAVNCAALPENLLESELFGHERGAFTGADKARPGLFETAHQGTLLLDEVGELPLALQPKLLRALEGGEIRRLGSTAPRKVDVRVIAATNRDLEEEVAAARFREDLFWRLNGLSLHVPPLRERPADIPVLIEHFLSAYVRMRGADSGARPRFDREALSLLTAYAWPGNVRELRVTVERCATLGGSELLDASTLPERVRDGGAIRATIAEASARRVSLADLERAYILEIVRSTGGNKSRAAEILGLDRKTLYRKLQEYGAEASS